MSVDLYFSFSILIFGLGILRKKIRKLRIYTDFLFGGLIVCQECASKMTPCFTNKRNEEKLKRYYNYRCTSTLKRDWRVLCEIVTGTHHVLDQVSDLEVFVLHISYLLAAP